MSKERIYTLATHPGNILTIEEINDIVKIVKKDKYNVIVKKKDKEKRYTLILSKNTVPPKYKHKIDDALKLNIYNETFKELKDEGLKEKNSEGEILPEDVYFMLRHFIDEKPERPYCEGMGHFSKNNEFIPDEGRYIRLGIGKLLKKYPAGLYIDIYKDKNGSIFLEVFIQSPFSYLATSYFYPERVDIIKYIIGEYTGCQVSKTSENCCQVSEKSYTDLSELFETIEKKYMSKHPFQRLLNNISGIITI